MLPKREADILEGRWAAGRGSRPRMLVTFLAILLAATMTWAQSTDRDADGANDAAQTEQMEELEETQEALTTIPADDATWLRGNNRIREGTEMVGQIGYFRSTGDRVTFFTDGGKDRFVVLENLNLERISRILAEDPEHLPWSVTATVTEYRGANYVFVRKAVRHDQRSPQNDRPDL